MGLGSHITRDEGIIAAKMISWNMKVAKKEKEKEKREDRLNIMQGAGPQSPFLIVLKMSSMTSLWGSPVKS